MPGQIVKVQDDGDVEVQYKVQKSIPLEKVEEARDEVIRFEGEGTPEAGQEVQVWSNTFQSWCPGNVEPEQTIPEHLVVTFTVKKLVTASQVSDVISVIPTTTSAADTNGQQPEQPDQKKIFAAPLRRLQEKGGYDTAKAPVCDPERALAGSEQVLVEKCDALEDAQVVKFRSSSWLSSIRQYYAEACATPPPPVQAVPVFEIASVLQKLERQREFPIDDLLDSSKPLFCEELRDLTLCMGRAMQVQCEAAGRQGALQHYQFIHKVFEMTPQFALSEWWSTNRKVAIGPRRAAEAGYWLVKEVYDCIYALEDGIDRNGCYISLTPHHKGLDFLLPLLVPELAHKDTRYWKDLKGYSNGIILAAEAVAKVGQEQADNRAMQRRLEQEWATEQARLHAQHERMRLRM